MRIDVQRNLDLGVPQSLLDYLGMDTLLEHKAGGGVTQDVEPHIGQPGRGKNPRKGRRLSSGDPAGRRSTTRRVCGRGPKGTGGLGIDLGMKTSKGWRLAGPYFKPWQQPGQKSWPP